MDIEHEDDEIARKEHSEHEESGEQTSIEECHENQSLVKSKYKNIIVSPDFAWIGRLIPLQKKAINTQYQLACLSTMGGAYHICNYPKQALALAIQQELIGRSMGATNIIVRAKLYQYVNLAMLGLNNKAKKTLKVAKACAAGNDSLVEFCDVMEKWYNNSRKIRARESLKNGEETSEDEQQQQNDSLTTLK